MNADDFGLTGGVNRAIVEARTRGIVTSATLMANSLAFDEAVQFAKADAGWSVGCHVVLLNGRPLCEASRVSSLVESRMRTHFEMESLDSQCGRLLDESIRSRSKPRRPSRSESYNRMD